MKKVVAAALLIIPSTAFAISCSRPPEQQFLTQFFRASRGRDNTTVGRMSAVELDPRTQGSVDDFSIENIGPEQRSPLTFKPLFEAEQKAIEEEKAFLKTKIDYQTANIKAIEEVLKLEAESRREVHAGTAEGQGGVGQVARRHRFACQDDVGSHSGD